MIMKVLVIREFLGDDNLDLRIVMVARTANGDSMISPIVTLDRGAPLANGNPYSVYGNACAKFTGKDKFDLSITVAACISGGLEGWE